MKFCLAFLALFCTCLFLFTSCADSGPSTAANSASSLNTAVMSSPTTQTGPNDVLITLTDFSVASTRTTFTAGVRYHFIIVNKGAALHEFMVAPPDMDSMSMEHMDEMALAHIDDIHPGQRVTLDLTFSKPAPAGTLEFSCHLFNHYQMGMKLKITVVKAN